MKIKGCLIIATLVTASHAQIFVDSWDAGDFSVSGTQSFSQTLSSGIGGHVIGGIRNVQLSGSTASATIAGGGLSFSGANNDSVKFTYGAYMQDPGAPGFLNGNWPEGWLEFVGRSQGTFQLTLSFSSSSTAVTSQTRTWPNFPAADPGFSTPLFLGMPGTADIHHIGGFQLEIKSISDTVGSMYTEGRLPAYPNALLLRGYATVPEPRAYAAVFGAGLLALAARFGINKRAARP